MSDTSKSASRWRCAAVATALQLSALAANAFSQSDVVFMTAAVGPSFENLLIRFDDGIQTFAVGTGEISAFQGLTVLDNEVLVADYHTTVRAIQRFSLDGQYLGKFAVSDSAMYLESDRQGNVYAAGFLRTAVATRFNSLGVVTQTFSHPDLVRLNGIDADNEGNVYIVSRRSQDDVRLFKFAQDGTFLNSTLLGATPARDLAIDESGRQLFLAIDAGTITERIQVFDISGGVPTFVDSIATPPSASLLGVHFAPRTSNILATQWITTPRGLEYSPNGTFLAQYVVTGGRNVFDIATLPVPEPEMTVIILAGILASCPYRVMRQRRAPCRSRTVEAKRVAST
jgi:hypothetical protein